MILQGEVIDEIDVVSMEDGKPAALEDTPGSAHVENQDNTTDDTKDTTQVWYSRNLNSQEIFLKLEK